MSVINENSRNTLLGAVIIIASLILVVFATTTILPVIVQSPKNTLPSESSKITPTLAQEVMKDGNNQVRVLITTQTTDYSNVIQAINLAGGSIIDTFQYTTGLAAYIPASKVSSISLLPEIVQIAVDQTLAPSSSPATTFMPSELNSNAMTNYLTSPSVLSSGLTTLAVPQSQIGSIIASNATTYNLGNVMNVGPVWNQGNFGQGSLVVEIDTGIYANHFMLQGSVLGGVDISSDVGTSYQGWNLSTNYWHGTHVAGIIAGHGEIVLPNNSLLVQSIELYTHTPLPSYDATHKIVYLFGDAPDAQLFGIKVFPHTGAGAPESTIMEGIEYAINMKLNEGYDVNVISMSLGGWNGFDGRDLEDSLVDTATAAGITVVVAAGNSGPYQVSIESPGTANTAISVGAIANPVNTKVAWDNIYGELGIGSYLYTSKKNQMIFFSSRGTTKDGRQKPTLSGLGVFVLSAFNTPDDPQGLAFASGTSMATPAVSGIVALLNTYGEGKGASPYDYQQALVKGATHVPGYDRLDQGAGLANAANAMRFLQHDRHLGQSYPSLSNHYFPYQVLPKGKMLYSVYNYRGDSFDVSLNPGMADYFWFPLFGNVEKITIDFSHVNLGNNPLGVNALAGYFQTGLSGYNVASVDDTYVVGNAEFIIQNFNTTVTGDLAGNTTSDIPIMPGYAKLVIENAWTSYGHVSGHITVHLQYSHHYRKADEYYSGTIKTGDSVGFFPVGFGPNGVQLLLSWKNNYFHYPTSDLDLIVAIVYNNGTFVYNYSGATANSPEGVVIHSPDINSVYVLIDGYNTYGNLEPYNLAVTYL